MAKRNASGAEQQPTLFDTPMERQVPKTGEPVVSPNLPVNFPSSWAEAIGTEFDKPYFAALRQFTRTGPLAMTFERFPSRNPFQVSSGPESVQG